MSYIYYMYNQYTLIYSNQCNTPFNRLKSTAYQGCKSGGGGGGGGDTSPQYQKSHQNMLIIPPNAGHGFAALQLMGVVTAETANLATIFFCKKYTDENLIVYAKLLPQQQPQQSALLSLANALV